MLLPGIVGKFMFIIPFVVTVGLAVSLVEAMWMLPAHVHALGRHSISQSRTQALRLRARLGWTPTADRRLPHPPRTGGGYLWNRLIERAGKGRTRASMLRAWLSNSVAMVSRIVRIRSPEACARLRQCAA